MALSLAGGLGRTAKPEKARIIRDIPGEPKLQQIVVNLKQIADGGAEDIGLHPRDILVVPTSGRKSFRTTFLPSMMSAAVYAAIYSF